MPASICLYSFGDVDRSGKVRWTAREIGLDIEERRLQLGDQVSAGYRSINPYAQVPTCVIDDEPLIESTAICLILAERFPGARLIPGPGPGREAFWQSVSLASSTLEQPVVNYLLASRGVIDSAWTGLVEKPLRKRLQALASRLPGKAYLHGEFSLADIFTAYVLRIALQAGLLPLEDPARAYMNHLRQRPAAAEARFFDSLDG